MDTFSMTESGIIFEDLEGKAGRLNGYFPHVIELSSSDLLAAFVTGRSMDSIDASTMVSSSSDGGRTWGIPRRLLAGTDEKRPATDSCKLTYLGNGRIAAFGYRFFRDDPEVPVGNPDTGGVLDDEVFFLLSEDYGKTFCSPAAVPVSFAEPVEASAPLTVLSNGHWVSPIANFLDWQGRTESGTYGRMLRSEDEGKTWNDAAVTMRFPEKSTCTWEQRACEMEKGEVIVISWVEDIMKGTRYPNHVSLSTDYGKTFGSPISTGIMGQAASIHYLGDNRVLSLHCIRRDTDHPGILACIAEVFHDSWHEISRRMIWEPEPFSPDASRHEVFAYLKFGQPSALKLHDGDWMLSFWYEHEGVSRILWRRFRID